MSLRARLALAATAAVAVAVAASCAAAYFVVRNELRSEIDDSLRSRVGLVDGGVADRPLAHFLRSLPAPRYGGPGGYAQLVLEDGQVVRSAADYAGLPADERALEVANGAREPFLTDARVQDTHVRVLTAPLLPGVAIQVARPLDEVDRTLDRLRLILVLLAAGGVGLAAALGAVVARTALLPVRRLSEAAQHVTETRDLSRRVEVAGGDELAGLATSFNTMLGALDESLAAQRNLVADASHELRTPLTSLRTNFELLSTGRLKPEDRSKVMTGIIDQLDELTALVGDVVELARDGEQQLEQVEVRLDLLTQEAVERARRHAPGTRFELDSVPSVVHGDSTRLARALANLLDNAAKWSPPDGLIEVRVHGGEVSIRDHGPGIAHEDLPFVFDRFYRSSSARGLPGSGLGLAIVRRVAELHGGAVTVETAEEGGTRFRLTLPEMAANEPRSAATPSAPG
jgi:two-component system sensor histidine kinase MprB